MKIRNGEVEFRLIGAGDGDKIVFCRRVVKDKFLRIFVPWVIAERAYNYLPGYCHFFSAEQFEKLYNSVKSWDDFKAWQKEQEEMHLANVDEMQNKWNEFKNQ